MQTYSNIFEGAEGYFISTIINSCNENLLYVVDNEKKIKKIKKNVEFFTSNIEVITIPNWDVLPYDLASPSNFVMARKLSILYQLENINKRFLLLITPQTLLQKTIPKNILMANCLEIEKNKNYKREDIVSLLVKIGYKKVDVTSETGDFSLRGSILDFYCNIKNKGIRLDFFGDMVESIKEFDPISQTTNQEIAKIMIIPSNEVIFIDEFIDNFKVNYKHNFKVSGVNDFFYEQIFNKHKAQAMEHYLPLFYNELDSIFNFLNKDIKIVFDRNYEAVSDDYKKAINDYYKARQTSQISKDDYKYYPVDPEKMWLNEDELERNLQKFAQLQITNFTDKSSIEFNIKTVPNFFHQAKLENKSVLEKLRDSNQTTKRIIICALSKGSLARIKSMLSNNDMHYFEIKDFQKDKKFSKKTLGVTILEIDRGFETENFIFISEQDLFGIKQVQKVKSTKKLENLLNEAGSLRKGELVVHAKHGIGIFQGLKNVAVKDIKHDFLEISYDKGDKLFVPVENIELITRYGDESHEIKLDKLGGTNFAERKARIKKKIKEVADKLLKIAAERKLKEGVKILPVKSIYEEFCARFPYIETDDQLAAIDDVEEDFASGNSMDRLICGDVGFGKTEIALRAAFMATHDEISSKMQVAIVVPTTILAKQHYENFVKRFEGFGVKIAMLSRLVKGSEAKIIKEGLANGDVDIIVGTHALLADKIKFKNLALLIIDEEQHFGVKQKEKLKEFKADVHVLTLTATPIPRTMQMSLLGIRDLSIIATPPVDRIAVKTYIMPFDKVTVREAILREQARQGKCFFVAPHVADLAELKLKIDRLLPEVKSKIVHGQMSPNTIDEVITEFYHGKFEVLISTAIVESGLDIKDANTIFIYKPYMFGLSALYQLRGRVGRGNIHAFAYLLLPPGLKPSPIAKQRLEVMQRLDSLGAGFSVATEDMDIRGFGNLLGEEQSGNVKEVGAELYQSMLKTTIEELEEQEIKEENDWSPEINIGLSVFIPEDYVPEINLRMGLYRRIANLANQDEVEEFKLEMIDRFGQFPVDVEHLMTIVKLKIICKKLHIEKIDAGEAALMIKFKNDYFKYSEELLKMSMSSTKIKIRPDQKLVFYGGSCNLKERVDFIFKSLAKLENIVNKFIN